MKIKLKSYPNTHRWYWRALFILNEPFAQKCLNWFNDRMVQVKFEKHDLWDSGESLKEALAQVYIHFKDTMLGWPPVRDEDVPDHMKVNDETNFDEFFAKERIEHVYNEIIWALTVDDRDWYDMETEEWQRLEARRNKGLELAGRYLSSLWN